MPEARSVRSARLYPRRERDRMPRTATAISSEERGAEGDERPEGRVSCLLAMR